MTPNRTPTTHWATARANLAAARLVKAQAKSVGLTPVYDENGKLVGLVDPKNLQPVKAAPTTSNSGAPAKETDAAKVARITTDPRTQPAVQDTAADITKALANTTVPIVKAAGGTVATRYAALTAALDPRTRNALDQAVAMGSLRLGVGLGIQPARAVTLAKQIALDSTVTRL